MAMSTTGLVVAAAAVAGAVGAGAAVLVAGGARPDPASPTASADATAIEERISRQEKELQRLRAELAELRYAIPAPAGRAAPPPAAGESVDIESLSADDRARFEALYNEIREKEQEEARKAREAQREAQLRARLERAQDQLNLTDAQKDTVVRVLMDRAERIRGVFSDARASGNPAAFREVQAKTAEIRDETRRTLEASLTPEQLKVVEGFADRGGDDAGRLGAGRFGGRRVGGPGPAPGGRRGDGGAPPR